MNVSESNAVFTLLAWVGNGTRWRRRPTAAEAGEALGLLGVRAGVVLHLPQDAEAIRAAAERFALDVGESADLQALDDDAVAFYGAARPAGPGERCTCGRPAVVVSTSGEGGEVGYCGRSGAPRLVPCVFCGATEPHAGTCEDYRLEVTTSVATAGGIDHRGTV